MLMFRSLYCVIGLLVDGRIWDALPWALLVGYAYWACGQCIAKEELEESVRKRREGEDAEGWVEVEVEK